MRAEIRVLLDTSVVFAAVHSETGGSRLILKLGEARALSLWIGPWVLREAEGVLGRKSPLSKGLFALLIHRSRIQVGREADTLALEQAMAVVDYLPDAHVLAEALTLGVGYLVSLDRGHSVSNPPTEKVPFLVGTPADFSAWYRKRLVTQLS